MTSSTTADGVVARDMGAPLPPSARGERTAAALANGAGTGDGAAGHDGRTITAEEAEADLQNKEAHGAVVHDFDADATPQQKKAQALKAAASKLGPLPGKIAQRHEGGTEIATDIGGKDVKPSISLADVNAASEQERGRGDSSATGQPAMPGGLSTEVASAIPEWYKVGWRAQNQALLDSGGDFEAARQRSLLAEFLDEAYYGSWYHNAAVIFFAVFSSHFVTVFGGGYGWLFIILATCATHYQLSMKRVRTRARDDLSRELSKQRLFTDVESVDWMNNFLSRFWLIYEPVLSAVIVASVDQTLSSSAPAGIDSMRMTHFTLGTKAPRIDFIRTHPSTASDVVVMDWKLSFTPNDTADLTTRQAADKVNPKVVLSIKFGKGKLVLTKDIVVEDVAFAGVMRIRLKLMANFPHVQLVDLSFLEKPMIDFVAKPIGFDINMIPGLENFIDNQVHATLGPMMYDPNVFTINLEQLLSAAAIDTAIGVLQVTIYNARGVKGVKFGGGLPDPYVNLGLGKRANLAKTKIKHSTSNPHWNETKFLLVNSLNDILTMDLFDYNDHRKDNELGAASFDLQTLAEDAEQEDLTTEILLGGKARGTVKFDLKYFPVLKPAKAADGTEEPLPDSKTGIVRITLHQAKDLDTRRSGSECNPYAKIYLKGQAIHKTPTFKRNHNPMWEASTEFLVTNKDNAVIGVKVVDSKGFASDPTLGYVNVKLADILAANARQQDWFPLSGASSGKIRMSAGFRPVAMAGAINSARDFRPPIGVVRIWLKKANDLKNVEALTGGKSDPYVRVVRRGIISARTLVHNNNLNPEFDEIVYCPVHHMSEYLVLEVMDYQHNSKDRSLGVARITLADLATDGASKEEPFVSTGPVERTSRLTTDHHGKIGKGSLTFEAIFYPTLPLKGVAFQAAATPIDQVAAKTKDEDNESIIEPDDGDDNATVDGDDDELSRRMKIEAASGDTTRRAAESVDGNGGPDVSGLNTGANTPFALGHNKNLLSNASIMTAETAGTTNTAGTSDGIALSREEILAHQSGVLVFNIMSGNLARKGARLEVAFDDAYWPSYSTEVARTTHQSWDEVGEAFIRELGYSRIILRLNEADKDSREDVQAIFRTSLSEFLEQCLDKPTDFMLTNENGGSRSTVTISAKYVPVPIKLEMRETVNNTGIIRFDLLEASGLKAADRNGKSDPYVEFFLGDEKTWTSQVQKKTLNPKWNEHFEMLVPSRVAAKCWIRVLDWDRLGSSDKLGTGTINVVDIEPFQSVKQTILLHGSDGKEQGTVDIRMVFRPEFVARTRASTSTFVGGLAGGAATGVGTVVGGGAHIVGKGGKLAVGGVGAVAGGVGHIGKGVFSGVRSVVPIGSRRHSTATVDNGDGIREQGIDGLPSEADPSHAVASATSGVNGRITHVPIGAGNPDFGNLQVTVTDIVGVAHEDKVHVQLRNGTKHVDKTSAGKDASGGTIVTFNLKTLPEAMVLTFSLVLKKTLGKDKELGSADLDVWQLISPGTRTSAEMVLGTGAGDMAVALSWTPIASSGSPVVQTSTISSTAPDSPASQKSKSRFSLHRQRHGTPS